MNTQSANETLQMSSRPTASSWRASSASVTPTTPSFCLSTGPSFQYDSCDGYIPIIFDFSYVDSLDVANTSPDNSLFAGLSSSISNASVATVGTFGPRHVVPHYADSDSESLASRDYSHARRDEPSPCHCSQIVSSDRPSLSITHTLSSDASDYGDSPLLLGSRTPITSTWLAQSFDSLPPEERIQNVVRPCAGNEEYLQHDVPSPAATCYTSEYQLGPETPTLKVPTEENVLTSTTRSIYPEHLEKYGSHSPHIYAAHEVVYDSKCSHNTSSALRKKEHDLPTSRGRDNSDEASELTKLTVNHGPSTSTSSMSGLPECLSWLKDITIELWIDQEGFRAVRPQFRLVRFCPQDISRDLHLGQSVRHNKSDNVSFPDALVEFKLVNRQPLVFHHAAFDREPSLRRITVNGDESRDYMSRQASLSLKENGVYVVTDSDEHKSDDVSVPLRWKLEYFVEDRRSDATRKIINGEKTLTLLSFFCSPGLLDPSHAMKIKFLHVMKKSMTPKLAAERMEPPMSSITPVLGTNLSPCARRTWRNPDSSADSVTDEYSAVHTTKERHVTNGFKKVLTKVSPRSARLKSTYTSSKAPAASGSSCNVTGLRIARSHKARSLSLGDENYRTRTRHSAELASQEIASRLVRPIMSRSELLKMFPPEDNGCSPPLPNHEIGLQH